MKRLIALSIILIMLPGCMTTKGNVETTASATEQTNISADITTTEKVTESDKENSFSQYDQRVSELMQKLCKDKQFTEIINSSDSAQLLDIDLDGNVEIIFFNGETNLTLFGVKEGKAYSSSVSAGGALSPCKYNGELHFISCYDIKNKRELFDVRLSGEKLISSSICHSENGTVFFYGEEEISGDQYDSAIKNILYSDEPTNEIYTSVFQYFTTETIAMQIDLYYDITPLLNIHILRTES